MSALLIVSSVAMFGCKGGEDSVNVSNNVSRSEAKSLASKVAGTWKGCSGLQYTSRSSLVVDDVTTNGEVYCTFNYLYMGAGCRRKRKTQKNDTQNAKNSKKIGE